MPSRRKIGVLTFHRCINYGSYWQARCLVEGVRARGHDAELLDHEHPLVTRLEWKCALRPTLPRPTARRDIPLYARKTRCFLSAFERLPRSRRFPIDRPEELEPYDLVLVGSDEVWNRRHPWYGGWPIFYGEGLPAGRLASYAASFGNQDAAEGIEDWRADRLRGFDAISVRDANSHALIRNALEVEPELVLDPCLQFPEAAQTEAGGARDYVAVYGHGFPDWFQSAVRRWAEASGKSLVSVGYRNDWADDQHITAPPEDFPRLIGGAAAVVTNFFHGCVFALLHGRPFACAPSDYRLNKVRDLAQALGAERHIARAESDASFYAEALGAPLAAAIGDRIDELRARSERYLAHALA